MILRLLSIVLALIIWGSGYAQSAGQTRYDSGQFQYYTGSAWQNMGRGASGSGACSTAGQVRYASGRMELQWQRGRRPCGRQSGACSTAGQTRSAAAGWSSAMAANGGR